MGKGSKRRPEDRKKIESNWDQIKWKTATQSPRGRARGGTVDAVQSTD